MAILAALAVGHFRDTARANCVKSGGTVAEISMLYSGFVCLPDFYRDN